MPSYSFTNSASLAGMARALKNANRAAILRFMAEKRLKVAPWCREAKITEGTLRAFLAGRTRSMAMDTFEQLAAAAGVTVEEMLGRATVPSGLRLVPVISTVQAGSWREVVDAYEPGHGSAEIAVDQPVGDNAFALEVEGDSMAPAFQEGDRIIVDPARRPRPGDFVVAKRARDDSATFKRYVVRRLDRRGRPEVELEPLNTAHPVLTLGAEGDKIIGVVVEHHRYLVR